MKSRLLNSALGVIVFAACISSCSKEKMLPNPAGKMVVSNARTSGSSTSTSTSTTQNGCGSTCGAGSGCGGSSTNSSGASGSGQ